MISLHLAARHAIRARFDSRGRCGNATLSVNNDIRLLERRLGFMILERARARARGLTSDYCPSELFKSMRKR